MACPLCVPSGHGMACPLCVPSGHGMACPLCVPSGHGMACPLFVPSCKVCPACRKSVRMQQRLIVSLRGSLSLCCMLRMQQRGSLSLCCMLRMQQRDSLCRGTGNAHPHDSPCKGRCESLRNSSVTAVTRRSSRPPQRYILHRRPAGSVARPAVGLRLGPSPAPPGRRLSPSHSIRARRSRA